jgi:hypothetical protein
MSYVIRKSAVTSDPAYMMLALNLIQCQAACHFGNPEAEHDLPCIEGMLEDELSTYAAESGMDRELCYCPERHMERVINEAHERTNQRYCY